MGLSSGTGVVLPVSTEATRDAIGANNSLTEGSPAAGHSLGPKLAGSSDAWNTFVFIAKKKTSDISRQPLSLYKHAVGAHLFAGKNYQNPNKTRKLVSLTFDLNISLVIF